MPLICKDFLGPYIIFNESISRPMLTLSLPESELDSCEKIEGTPTVGLIFEGGVRRIWHDCGASTAYMLARDTLCQKEFERFVCMEAAFSVMSSGPYSHRIYPLVSALHPEGHVNCRLQFVKDHIRMARAFQQVVRERRKAIHATRGRTAVRSFNAALI